MHGIVGHANADGARGIGKPLAVGHDVALDFRGVEHGLADPSQGIEADRREIRGHLGGEVLGGHHDRLARRAFQLLQPAADQLDGRQLREQPLVVGPAIARTLTGDQIHRVGTRLLDEAEQDLGRHRHSGLVVVPGSRGKIEAASQLGSAVIAKELLADLPQAAR